MPVVVFLLVKMFVLAIRKFASRERVTKQEPLCVGCSYAHVQYSANGKSAISCTYGGMVRPITLDVLYCTDYRNRNIVTPPKRIGFLAASKKAA